MPICPDGAGLDSFENIPTHTPKESSTPSGHPDNGQSTIYIASFLSYCMLRVPIALFALAFPDPPPIITTQRPRWALICPYGPD